MNNIFEQTRSKAIREKLEEMLTTLEYMISNDLRSPDMRRYYLVKTIEQLKRAIDSI